jgi:CDP-diacylglycerol--serine O-phosphatidyltransferase
MGLNNWYNIPIYIIFGICGVARLAYFNITLDETNKDKAVKYYSGLPVTFTALIIPLIYLISYIIPISIHTIYFTLIMFIVSMLNVLNIKIKKPTLKVYPVFIILAIIVLILFLGVL